LHSLPNYLSNQYNKIPFHCQDKSWSFFEG